jgi:hypothetical protein
VLAGPRRTRPVAGVLYGLLLSRAQGASRRNLDATVRGLFDQRSSVLLRVEALEQLVAAHVARTHAGVNALAERLDAVEADGVSAGRPRRGVRRRPREG